MGRFLCKIGIHRWAHRRNPESGTPYLECERCRKQKDIFTLADTGGGAG